MEAVSATELSVLYVGSERSRAFGEHRPPRRCLVLFRLNGHSACRADTLSDEAFGVCHRRKHLIDGGIHWAAHMLGGVVDESTRYD